MATGWFPRFSPDGAHLATGSVTITLYDVTAATGALSNPRTFGTGIRPVWMSSTRLVWGNRIDGTSAGLISLSSPYTTPAPFGTPPIGLTAIDAGGDLVAVYNAAGAFATRIFNSAGAQIASLGGQAFPSVDTNGRYATVARTDDGIFVSGTGRVANEPAVAFPRIGTGGVVWSKLTSPRRTHGWRGGSVEDVSIFSVNEFEPCVIDTPAGPWILLYTEASGAGLYVHPWGNTNAVLVQGGGSNQIQYPHGVYHGGSGNLLAAWTNSNGVLSTTAIVLPILNPLFAVGSGGVITPGPPGTGSSAPSTTPTQKQDEAKVLAAARAPRRQYPHVTEVTDPFAQKTLRLIWDRLFDMDEQLNGTRPSKLQEATAQVGTSFATYQAAQTLAMQQLQAQTTGEPLEVHPFPSGGSTTPGGGSGGGGGGGGGTGGGGGEIGNHLDVVVAARATYDALGPGVERAGRITNQVAWDLKNLGVGTVHKTSGANFMGWSIDVIMVNPSAATYDILGDAEGNANPQWSRTSPTGFGNIADWQAPLDPTSF